MHASSLCTIIGMLSLGMSWAQELGNWKAIGGEVKGGGFQYLGAMHLPAQDQTSCSRPKIKVQIGTKGTKLPENLAMIFFSDRQESFAQIGRSFTHTGKFKNFCENTVEASKTFYRTKTHTRGRSQTPCGWKDTKTLQLSCGVTSTCTKGIRVEKFHKISTAKHATTTDAQAGSVAGPPHPPRVGRVAVRVERANDQDTWQYLNIAVSQKQAHTWYFAVAQCGDAPMTNFKFRIDSAEALPIPEPTELTEEEDEDDGDTFLGGYAYGAIGGAGLTLFVVLLCYSCAYCIRACVRKMKAKSPAHRRSECNNKKRVVPVDDPVAAKVLGQTVGQTVVVGHAVVL